MGTHEIYNYVKINESLITGGQPTADQLRSAAEEGFSVVINLATYEPEYSLADEAALVERLGMQYFNIPVEWGNPLESDFEAFEQVMEGLPEGKTLIHCAANYRVTAFYSLYAQKHLGWSEAQADEFRAVIWRGSDEPVWNQFIERVKAQIT